MSFAFQDRLQTIISYDRILVMDQGTVAVSIFSFAATSSYVTTFDYAQEFDTPLSLFQKTDGIFRSLCEKGGISLDDIVRGDRSAK